MWAISDTFGAIHTEVVTQKEETKSHDYSIIK